MEPVRESERGRQVCSSGERYAQHSTAVRYCSQRESSRFFQQVSSTFLDWNGVHITFSFASGGETCITMKTGYMAVATCRALSYKLLLVFCGFPALGCEKRSDTAAD